MSLVTDLNINWAVFHPSEKEILEKALMNGHAEQLAAILYEVTPEKAAEIEKIQAQLRPKDFVFESSVQKEFEVWLDKNQNLLTPEIAADWDEKIQKEKEEKLRQLTGGKIEVKAETIEGSKLIGAKISNLLVDVKGLGEASISKLHQANINNIEQFRALSFEEKRKILGPVVAANFKDFN